MARPGFWIDTKVTGSVTIGTTRIESLMTNVSASQSRRGWTLVRTIIGIDVAYSVHDAGEGSIRADLGIAVASQAAFASGAGALSDPAIATEHPTRGWIYRAGYRVFGFAADQPAVYSVRIDKDIRAKRKLDNGECFLAVTAALLEGASTTLDLTGWIRQYWLDE